MPSDSLPDPISRLRALTSPKSETFIIVFYRGEWCPFCSTWAQGLSAMRKLSSRLDGLNANVVFVSSQSERKEKEAAAAFRFTPARSLGDRVHFINDPRNKIAALLNRRWKGLVAVETVPAHFIGGMTFPEGMVQPGVVCVRGLFTGKGTLLYKYRYENKGARGVNGNHDCPPSSSVLRRIEEMHQSLQAPDGGSRGRGSLVV